MAIATADPTVSDILQILQRTDSGQAGKAYSLPHTDAPGQAPPSGLGAVMAALGGGDMPTPQGAPDTSSNLIQPPVAPAIDSAVDDNSPASMLAKMIASQGQGPVVPPGLMPTSVPTNHFDEHHALRSAGAVGGILAIMNALGVISPQTMGQLGGNAVSTTIESQKQTADAQYKEELGAYAQRHQLVSDYVNAARLDSLQKYRDVTAATKIDTEADTQAIQGDKAIKDISPKQFQTPEEYDAAIEASAHNTASTMTPEKAKAWLGTVHSHMDQDGHYPDMSSALSFRNAEQGNTQETQQVLNEDKHKINLHTISQEQVGDFRHVMDVIGTDGYAGMDPTHRATVIKMMEHSLGIPMGSLGVPSSMKDLNERLKAQGLDLTKQNLSSEEARRAAETRIADERTDIMRDDSKSRSLIDTAHAAYFRYMMHEDPTGKKLWGELPMNNHDYQLAYNQADRAFEADDKLVNDPKTPIKFDPAKLKAMQVAHQDPDGFMGDPNSAAWLNDPTVSQILHHALLYNKLWAQGQAGSLGYNSPDMQAPPMASPRPMPVPTPHGTPSGASSPKEVHGNLPGSHPAMGNAPIHHPTMTPQAAIDRFRSIK